MTLADIQERRAIRFLWGVLAIGCVWPILSARYLPLVDLPAHASQLALWEAHASDPRIQQSYVLHYAASCVGFYLPWRLLMSVGLSLEAAGRVLIALTLLAVPLGVFLLLHARGRPVEWSLLAFPLVFTQPFAWGFLPFYFAFAGFFWALAAFSVWLRKGGVRWAALVVGSGLYLLWCHSLTVGFWGLSCGVLALVEGESLQRKLRGLAPLVPVGIALVAWVLFNPGSGGDVSWSGTFWQRAGTFFQAVSGGTTPGVTQAAGLLRLIVLAVLVVTLVRAVRIGTVPTWMRTFDLPLLGTVGVALALYFLMPLSMFRSDLVCVRFAAPAYLLFIAALPGIPSKLPRLLVLGSAAAVALTVDLQVANAYRAFNERLGDADGLLARLPRGASVDRPNGAPRSIPPLELRVMDNFALWGQVRTLGAATSFTRYPHMLVEDAAVQPDPLFDATLVHGVGGTPSVSTTTGRLPDALVFFSANIPPEVLPIVGGAGTYRLTGRTGGLNAYQHERPH